MALEQVTMGKTNEGEVSWPKFIGEKVVMGAILMFVISCVQQVRICAVDHNCNQPSFRYVVCTAATEDNRRREAREAEQVGVNGVHRVSTRGACFLCLNLNSYFNKDIRLKELLIYTTRSFNHALFFLPNPQCSVATTASPNGIVYNLDIMSSTRKRLNLTLPCS